MHLWREDRHLSRYRRSSGKFGKAFVHAAMDRIYPARAVGIALGKQIGAVTSSPKIVSDWGDDFADQTRACCVSAMGRS
jgi:hypothetical protein